MFDDVDLSGSHNGRSIQISNLPDVSVRHRPVRKSKMLRSTYGTRLPATRERTPSSRVLADLLRQAPPDHFTLGWLLSTLHQRSFGVVILFLGILATAPIGSSVPGIMLAAVAVQMIAGIRDPSSRDSSRTGGCRHNIFSALGIALFLSCDILRG